MVRGPYHDGDPKKIRPGDVSALAREAGQRLVADLDRAEALTAGWSNEKLGLALAGSALDRCLARLASTGCWGRDNQLPSGDFWSAAGARLEQSWLKHRARFKPRGYAGDFEMFERFWRRQCCEHPLGRLLDHYFQSQAAVEAVRTRTEQIAAAAVDHYSASQSDPYRLASVGCGPAIDVALAVEAIPPSQRSRLQITLLDLDEAALDHARGRLAGWLSPRQIVAARENLYRLADRPKSAALLQEADCLICSGLFDYLPDDSAQKLLRSFWTHLAPGGTLIVGNFAPHNPTRAYMEWIGNWYLIYRTADELSHLAAAAGIPPSRFAIGAERLGIDLFVVADRPGRD
ncbi:MAG TPA: class I SAM-dependent methyltransferase [Pirellulales bacterium]|nr:class I SAM-dependent methyltransferase [Pirellulales bacterium]